MSRLGDDEDERPRELLEAADRVFVYVRLTDGDEVLARSKVRELAGLASALADLTASVLRGEVPLRPGQMPRFEYVDAETETPLISMFVDLSSPEGPAQVLEGYIPPARRKRMIDRPPVVDAERFEQRASRELDDAQRWQLDEALSQPSPDVLSLIREHIDDDGRFHIRLPLGPDGPLSP